MRAFIVVVIEPFVKISLQLLHSGQHCIRSEKESLVTLFTAQPLTRDLQIFAPLVNLRRIETVTLCYFRYGRIRA